MCSLTSWSLGILYIHLAQIIRTANRAVPSIFRTHVFCSSISNCIAYTNEASIVNKDLGVSLKVNTPRSPVAELLALLSFPSPPLGIQR